VKGMYRLVDQAAADQVDGWLRTEFPDVPQVILARTGKVRVDGSWA
jgi:hypothetical protein